MFSAEHQKLYLFIVTTAMVVLFGPALFVCHTFGHLNTCQKWAGTGCFGSLYTMCPPKPSPLDKDDDDEDKNEDPEDKKPLDETPDKNHDPNSSQNPRNGQNPENPGGENPRSTSPPGKPMGSDKHTESQKFYSWLTDSGGAGNSGDILFRPSLA
ncbi:unnamed protein product [Caenorhabditis sp. 36 PRJEB53466]|nr:unnamed protein product [Caenorhabditis sp. 36 PRJEB53466]